MIRFNSRSPSGLRLQIFIRIPCEIDVSIHAAQAGCDRYKHSTCIPRFVSIHAAQAGCDLLPIQIIMLVLAFQFTQPKWVATGSWYCWHWFCHCFNSRSPNGLRLVLLRLIKLRLMFQFTQPKWAATRLFATASNKQCVSIHAAQMGCDRHTLGHNINHYLFQFTQPKWAATLLL